MKASKRIQWGSFAVTAEHLSPIEKVFLAASFSAVIVLTFPHLALAQSVQDSPLVFEINIPDNLNVTLGDLPMAPNGVDTEKIIKLQEYLKKKNPLLVNYADVLARQYHYRLVLGISFAESNFCKHQIRPNNCWGIGGSELWKMGDDLSEGIMAMNNFLEINPKKSKVKYAQMSFEDMNGLYKKPPKDHWVAYNQAVPSDLTALEESL